MAKKSAPETATDRRSEETVLPVEERATHRPAEDRRQGPPRGVRTQDYSRANPRATPVRVVRSWPGVKNGQMVVLHPDHRKRLLKGGFIEEVR